MVLDIFNERVSAIREKYKYLRTVVLSKSNDLSEVVVFEFDTIRYDPELFVWEWNKNNNLVGKVKASNEHRFTWQPLGSQFIIVENVPYKHLVIRIMQPEKLDKELILQALSFDKTWITVEQNG